MVYNKSTIYKGGMSSNLTESLPFIISCSWCHKLITWVSYDKKQLKEKVKESN